MKTLKIVIAALSLGFACGAQRRRCRQGRGEGQAVCAACHGADRNEADFARCGRVAGQHQDYLYQALRDYKTGKRKNAIMAGQAQALTDEDMRNLAAYFSAQQGSLKVIR